MTTREVVFQFVVAYKREHDGCSPSERQIAEACSLTTKTVARYHLDKLVDDGRIVLNGDGTSRGIQVVGGCWTFEGNMKAEQERQRLERLVWQGYERDKQQLLAMLESGLLSCVGYESACIAAADRWEVALLGAPIED